MKDALDSRMKENYEHRSRFLLTRRTPVIIRVDGRAFHTYTKGFPAFSDLITLAMQSATEALCKEVQGAKVAYTQSDEISIFLTDYDKLTSDAWFGYNVQKMASVSAAIATAAFNSYIRGYNAGTAWRGPAQFDARVFNIPKEEVTNYFLWRAKDWHRNSIMMYAQSFFSHKELLYRSCGDVLAMLEAAGHDWTDLQPAEKNGTFMYYESEWVTTSQTRPNYEEIDFIVSETLPCTT